jgi:methanobactin biosynthesis MbnP-like protein
MTSKTIVRSIFLFSIIGLSLTACKKKGCTDPDALNYNASAKTDDGTCTYKTTGCLDPWASNYDPNATGDDGSCEYEPNSILVNFKYVVGNDTLTFDEMKYVNEAGNQFSVITLRYYVSDFTFHNNQGNGYFADIDHYVSGRDKSTTTFQIKNLPDDTYNSISFVFGLDTIKNKTGYLPNNQVNNTMEWPVPMGGGYHHMKFEGKYIDSAGQTASFNVHSGRAKDSLDVWHNNHVEVGPLPVTFEMSNNTWSVELIMDLNEIFRNPNTYDFNNFGSAIMNNPIAQKLINDNMKTVFKAGNIMTK